MKTTDARLMSVFLTATLAITIESSEAQSPTGSGDVLDHWSLRSANHVNRVRYAGSRFIAVGNNGLIMTSTDGASWDAPVSGTSRNLRSVACSTQIPIYPPFGAPYFGTVYVAVGDGGALLTSTNAITWNLPSMQSGGTIQDLTDIACRGTRFVAVAQPVGGDPGHPNIFYSDDAVKWTAVSIDPSNPGLYMGAVGVAGNYFVAGASETIADDIYRSSDGKTWKKISNADQYIEAFATGGGLTLLVGYEGWPRVSRDNGASWTQSVVGCIPTQISPGIGSDVTYGDNLFVVARGSGGSGLLTMTADGVWSARDPLNGQRIWSVAYGYGRFVIAADDGVYVSNPLGSPFILPIRFSKTNGANISISGQVGRAYQIQVSTNLVKWDELATVTNTAGFLDVADTNVTRTRFYRVIGK